MRQFREVVRGWRLAVLVFVGAALVTGYSSSAKAEGRCNNKSLRGIYAMSVNGFRTYQPPPMTLGAFAPVAVFGTLSFDGAGNISRNVTVSYGGLPFPVVDSGTYLMNPDCSGTLTFSVAGETLGVILEDDQTVAIATTTSGEVGAGTLVKQQVHNCKIDAVRGVYVFNGNGNLTVLPTPQLTDGFYPVSISGTLSFDGHGNVARNVILNFAGYPFPYVDVGTYQVNSDCTASAFFSSDEEPFRLLLVSSETLVSGVMKVGDTGVFNWVKQEISE